MDRHCPVFVLECAATYACINFLTGTLPLDLICKKICDHINKQYKELALEDLLDQYNKGNKNLLNKVMFRNFVKKFFQTYAG